MLEHFITRWSILYHTLEGSSPLCPKEQGLLALVSFVALVIMIRLDHTAFVSYILKTKYDGSNYKLHSVK